MITRIHFAAILVLAMQAFCMAQDPITSPPTPEALRIPCAPAGTVAVPRVGPAPAFIANHPGDGWASVKDFGAKGDGVTDDSAAFQNAFNSGAKKIFVPATAKYYRVKDVILPEGVELEGIGRKRVYTAPKISSIEGSCAIVFDTSGSFLIAFSGNNKISNLNFHGVDRSCDGFGPGSGGSLFFRDVGMYRFAAGFGKTSGPYGHNCRLWNCNASGNTTGIRNFRDSHFYGCEINANEGEGVNLQAGADDNTFVGCKVEWNGKSNWKLYQCVNNGILGGVTDRSGGSYGFDIRQSQLTINGTVIRRSGRDDAVLSAHFLLGSNVSLLLNGIITKTGADDNGGGNVTPAYLFSVTDASSGPTVINGCDLTGFVTGFKTGSPLDVVLRGNEGIADNARYIASGAFTLSPSGSTAVPVSGAEVEGIDPYSSKVRRYRICASFRNPSTGGVAVNDFAVAITRGGSGGAAAQVYRVADPSSTTINLTGALLNIAVTNLAPDGASFEVTASSACSTSLQVRIEVLPFL